MIPVDCLSQKAKDDDDDEMMVMLVVMTLTEGALGREDDTETEVAKVTMGMVMDGDNGDGGAWKNTRLRWGGRSRCLRRRFPLKRIP